MEEAQSIFRILSIDGGGIRGIIAARILQSLEEIANKPIHQLFDLIVGTSTGGIIALALTCPNQAQNAKFSAKQLVDIYRLQAGDIFKKSFLRKIITGGGLWGAKYDRTSFDSFLNQIFEDSLFSQALCPLVIPTYSLLKGQPNLFSSRETLQNNIALFMKDLAGATSSAPTYFSPKAFTDNQGNHYLEADGGIFANNPEAVAAAEAFELCPNLSKNNIHIISIGTGNVKLGKGGLALKNAGVIGWVMQANLIDIMIDSNVNWANDEVSIYYPSAHRLQIPIPSDLGQMDNISEHNIKGLLNAAEKFIGNNSEVLKHICKR
ncbi:MAG TPA: CBASS cGAMP-activated phospholipase [Gammaproteobacteria bacterium]|nr:CBASS cGAMP-activated phospholipase [Gammaproteobacteria bacterium]